MWCCIVLWVLVEGLCIGSKPCCKGLGLSSLLKTALCDFNQMLMSHLNKALCLSSERWEQRVVLSSVLNVAQTFGGFCCKRLWIGVKVIS
jgi:hypothetical protein